MNTFSTVVLGGLVLITLPALIAGGFVVVVVLGGLWLAVTYGGKIGLEVFKERQTGATAAKYQTRSDKKIFGTSNDDGRRWDR